MKHLALTLSLLLVIATSTQVVLSQQPAASQTSAINDPHALKIRHKLEHIGFNHDVTVKLRHGRDYHGSIVAIEDDVYKINEIDLNKLVSISYTDTGRIDQGYSRKSLIGGHRTNPHTRTIISLAALGGMMTMILLVVRAAAQ